MDDCGDAPDMVLEPIEYVFWANDVKEASRYEILPRLLVIERIADYDVVAIREGARDVRPYESSRSSDENKIFRLAVHSAQAQAGRT
jgi:hypothetical protein